MFKVNIKTQQNDVSDVKKNYLKRTKYDFSAH